VQAQATLLSDLEAIAPFHQDWDALAVECARPYCVPAWMLAWWRHVAPQGAELRVVAVHDGDALIGIAPFFAEPRPHLPTRWRILAAGTSHRVQPLARRGRERDVARAVAGALAGAYPYPEMLSFENVEAESGWHRLLAEFWPGAQRPWVTRRWSGPAPTVRLTGLTFDDWLGTKSHNFRNQSRRLRRRMESRGARFRAVQTEAELDWALAELTRLHHARWEDRGGSVALTPAVGRMLADAGRALLGGGRLRLVVIEAGGRAISVQLLVAAGGELSYWNGGFDEEWADTQPAMRALVAAVEDAFARGEDRLDLGGGGEHYKRRLADGADILETALLVPRGGRYGLTRAQLMPRTVGRAVATRLPEDARERLRRLRRTVPA